MCMTPHFDLVPAAGSLSFVKALDAASIQLNKPIRTITIGKNSSLPPRKHTRDSSETRKWHEPQGIFKSTWLFDISQDHNLNILDQLLLLVQYPFHLPHMLPIQHTQHCLFRFQIDIFHQYMLYMVDVCHRIENLPDNSNRLSNSYKMQPSDHTSLLKSYPFPRSTSGDMYKGVPTLEWACNVFSDKERDKQ